MRKLQVMLSDNTDHDNNQLVAADSELALRWSEVGCSLSLSLSLALYPSSISLAKFTCTLSSSDQLTGATDASLVPTIEGEINYETSWTNECERACIPRGQ